MQKLSAGAAANRPLAFWLRMGPGDMAGMAHACGFHFIFVWIVGSFMSELDPGVPEEGLEGGAAGGSAGAADIKLSGTGCPAGRGFGVCAS